MSKIRDKQGHLIIFYEIITREVDACKKIKNELESKYNYNVHLLSIFWDYTKAIKLAKKYKINAIIMPWMYSEKDYNLILPFLKLNKSLKVFNLYNEQIASDETLPITLCRGDIVKQNIFHLCWGEYFKELLEKNGVPSTNAIVAGNARLDSALVCRYSRNELAEQFGLDLNKKWVLFAESRDWVLFEDNLRDRISLGLPEELELRSYEVHKKALYQTYNELDQLDDAFFDKYELIYRPHPASPSPENINKKVKINSNFTIYDWLDNIDYYLTATSTSIFEAEAKGVPAMVIEGVDWPQEFKTYGLSEYFKIESLQCFNEENIEKAKEHSLNKKIYEKYIGKCDGENHKRIAKIIDDIIKKINLKPMKYFEHELYELKFTSKIKMHIAKTLIKFKLSKLMPKNSTYLLLKNDAPFLRKNKKFIKK